MNWYELLFYKYIKGAQGQSKLRIMTPVFKGGTEQILPENGSTPTTAPIIADIRYPDALRTDQTFLYRESPTQESGNARLKRIKGNSIAFNQLIENGNFASTSKWFAQEGATQSVSNNVMTVTSSADRGFTVNVFNNIPAGHKCLVSCECKTASPNARAILVYCGNYNDSSAQITLRSSSTNWERLTGVVTSASGDVFQFRLYADSATNQFRNVMLIDLTLLNASYITDYNSFKSYFPLSYYSYQSTLLPFKGTGIKTVGKNLLDLKYSRPYYVGGTYVESGITSVYDNQTIKVSGTATATAFVNLTFYSNVSNAQDFTNLANKQVKMSAVELPSGTAISIQYFKSDGTYTGVGASLSPSQLSGEFTMPSDAVGLRSYLQVNNGTTVDFTLKVMLTFADADNTFEPYTSSTTDLPTLTYFPNGMNRVGNAYDELTENVAIKRLHTIIFDGTETFTTGGEGGRNFVYVIPNQTDYGKFNVYGLYSKGQWGDYNFSAPESAIGTVSFGVGVADRICFLAVGLRMTMDQFKQELATAYANGTPYAVCYELATPTETDINTEDTNEALSLLMGKSVSSNNAKQMIDIITKGE